uniref:Uncharacterized protein n=1 Tax=Oryza glumipatula TaxID=40148 RepID=A0A0D9YS83_9ORYZ
MPRDPRPAPRVPRPTRPSASTESPPRRRRPLLPAPSTAAAPRPPPPPPRAPSSPSSLTASPTFPDSTASTPASPPTACFAIAIAVLPHHVADFPRLHRIHAGIAASTPASPQREKEVSARRILKTLRSSPSRLVPPSPPIDRLQNTASAGAGERCGLLPQPRGPPHQRRFAGSTGRRPTSAEMDKIVGGSTPSGMNYQVNLSHWPTMVMLAAFRACHYVEWESSDGGSSHLPLAVDGRPVTWRQLPKIKENNLAIAANSKAKVKVKVKVKFNASEELILPANTEGSTKFADETDRCVYLSQPSMADFVV